MLDVERVVAFFRKMQAIDDEVRRAVARINEAFPDAKGKVLSIQTNNHIGFESGGFVYSIRTETLKFHYRRDDNPKDANPPFWYSPADGEVDLNKQLTSSHIVYKQKKASQQKGKKQQWQEDEQEKEENKQIDGLLGAARLSTGRLFSGGAGAWGSNSPSDGSGVSEEVKEEPPPEPPKKEEKPKKEKPSKSQTNEIF